MKGLLIEDVVPGSLGGEQGITPGDRLIAIDGHRVRDLIDYHYWSDAGELLLEVEKQDGSHWECEVVGADEEPLGLIFQAPQPARCRNACLFCFVHQLPKGLRKPLYVKDEDYRLSFLCGNYVTLANATKADLARIIRLGLSPLYISVHATDPALRERLLGRTGIVPILQVMQKLASARITMHTQIVLCPGLNDGAALDQTVADLAALYPQVASLAIVPLGLTSHRKGLPELTPVSSDYSRAFIEEWQPRSDKLADDLGEPFLFLADEFYLKAGIPFPPIATYGELPQLENGVGMVPLFRDEAEQLLLKVKPLVGGSATIVSGLSMLPVMEEFLAILSEKSRLRLTPIGVENRLFGPSVTVTGLVPGRDIIYALKGLELGDLLILPDVMLKEGEGLFLDDMNIADLQRELGVKVAVAESSPDGLYAVLRKEFGRKRRKVATVKQNRQ